jgi:hypothetical protein
MTEAEEFFVQLTSEIPHAKPGKMFGSLCMKLPNGKSGAMIWKDHIVVKLKGEDLKQAEKLKGAMPFEPMKGRPMKEWLQVPFDHRDKWKALALASAGIVGDLEKKTSTKKKPK